MSIKPSICKKVVIPLKPDSIPAIIQERIEPEMIEAVNELIKKKITGNSATFKQKELVEKYLEIKGLNEEAGKEEMQRVFNEHKMDFEELFRSAGWKVSYNRPDYTENYEPYFTLSK